MMLVLIRKNYTLQSYQVKNRLSLPALEIYASQSVFYLRLKEGYLLEDERKVIRLNQGVYQITNSTDFSVFQLYVYDHSDGLENYAFYKNGNFIMAASDKADIVCHDPFLQEHYFYIRDGIIKSSFPLSVNARRYDGERLAAGDVIEYLGEKIFWYEDFLYMNCFQAQIRLQPYKIKYQHFAYTSTPLRITGELPSEKRQLQLPLLQEYEALKALPERDILRNILPNLVMSASTMSAALISWWYNPAYGAMQPLLVYLLSPAAMLICGVFIPLAFHLKDRLSYRKKYKEQMLSYTAYLDQYEIQLKEKITAYLDYERQYLFTPDQVFSSLFCVYPDDEMYLRLSLGSSSFSLPFDYSCKEEEIDRHLQQIARHLEHLQDKPLFLDLKTEDKVTIITKEADRAYFIREFLLELASRHHPAKLKIALYVPDLSFIDDFYDLPHLFIDGRRLTFTSESQLTELEHLSHEVPVVIFLCKKTAHVFHDPAIHVLLFTSEREERYHESSLCLEYLNQQGIIYGDKRQDFSYVRHSCDFKKMFAYLGRFNTFFDPQENVSFMSRYADFDLENSYRLKHKTLKTGFMWDEDIEFDLHETKQGPHGLIGGATGSGKSELLVSLLLSLCIRYGPNYLNIVLIDYKGGGLEDSLTCATGKIPQLVASLTNLENNALDRLLIALKRECQKRQLAFRRLTALAGIPIMDLDAYLDGYEEYGMPPLAHLLIVVDEFAELRKENPEQIRELISLSRIGRSLGLHLILATQKPAGNIDDEIWSNSRFKLALKVYEKRDSQDLLHSEEAAKLQHPGEFLLRIDDELYRSRSLYAKSDISDNDPYEVELLDETLKVTQFVRQAAQSVRTQASWFVEKMIKAAEQLQQKAEPLDFLAPPALKRKDILEKGLVLGETDDYINGERKPLVYDLKENLLICTSRKKQMDLILNVLSENSRQTIVISSSAYHSSCVSDVINYESDEDIIFLWDLLEKEDPQVTIVIEALEIFLSYRDEYSERLYKLIRRNGNMNFNFIALTRSLQLPFRVLNGFTNRVLIGTSERNDIMALFNERSEYKGDSFYQDPKGVICFVPCLVEELSEAEPAFPELIRQLPEKIPGEVSKQGYLLGYDLKRRIRVFGQKGMKIVAYEDRLLEVYRQAYGETFQIMNYEEVTGAREFGDFLWLGPGTFYQRLFLSGLKEDLSDNEAIYVKAGEKIRLRIINNE